MILEKLNIENESTIEKVRKSHNKLTTNSFGSNKLKKIIKDKVGSCINSSIRS